MTVKVSSKYQVVIPEHVRNILNIKPGAKMEVMVKGGIAYLVPVQSLDSLRKNLKKKLDSKNLREKRDRIK